MREILFRGKRADNGEWVYGGIVHQTDYYGKKCDRWFIIDGTDTQDYDIGYEYEVATETVGQYTGLTDKNGKKIFEGDIILEEHSWYESDFGWNNPSFAIPTKTYFCLKWHEYGYRPFYIYHVKDGHTSRGHYKRELYHSDYEDWYDHDCLGDNSVVWGNIFDNKDFIEKYKALDIERAKVGYAPNDNKEVWERHCGWDKGLI